MARRWPRMFWFLGVVTPAGWRLSEYVGRVWTDHADAPARLWSDAGRGFLRGAPGGPVGAFAVGLARTLTSALIVGGWAGAMTVALAASIGASQDGDGMIILLEARWLARLVFSSFGLVTVAACARELGIAVLVMRRLRAWALPVVEAVFVGASREIDPEREAVLAVFGESLSRRPTLSDERLALYLYVPLRRSRAVVAEVRRDELDQLTVALARGGDGRERTSKKRSFRIDAGAQLAPVKDYTEDIAGHGRHGEPDESPVGPGFVTALALQLGAWLPALALFGAGLAAATAYTFGVRLEVFDPVRDLDWIAWLFAHDPEGPLGLILAAMGFGACWAVRNRHDLAAGPRARPELG